MPVVPSLREQAFFEYLNQGKTRVQAAQMAYNTTSDDSARAVASRITRKFRGQSYAKLAKAEGVQALDLNKIKLEGCVICREELADEYFCADPRCKALWQEFPAENESSLPFIGLWRELMAEKAREARQMA